MRLNIKHILVPTDFSELSLSALNYAAAMAKHSGAKITLLHVMETYQYNSLLNQVIDVNQAIKRAVEEKLVLIKNDNIALWGIDIEVSLVTGKIHKEIKRTIEEEGIDLVVMGVTGSSGIQSLGKMMMGSNTIKIVRIAECPVITIRQPREDVQFRKILLPLDTSKRTRQKVDSAIKLAKVFGASIDLLSVHTRIEEFYVDEAKLEEELRQVAEEISDMDIPVSTKMVRQGNVPKAVIEYSEEVGSDLIIIMVAEESRWNEYVIGTSAQKVISQSNIPVLSLRPSED